MTEFTLGISEVLASDRIAITNYSPCDIPIGAKIQSVYLQKNVGTIENPSYESYCIEAVDLEITSVEIFRKPIEVIPKGWSAGISVIGDGVGIVGEKLESTDKDTIAILSGVFTI